jgi:two-component system, cell cycle sensor histidine kinase and response regulator CckA
MGAMMATTLNEPHRPPTHVTEREELRALYEVTAIVARASDLEAASDRIAGVIRDHIGCAFVTVELVDDEHHTTSLCGWAGPALPKRLRTLQLPLEGSYLAGLQRRKNPVCVRAADLPPAGLHPALLQGASPWLVTVPLRADGRVGGALHVGLAGDADRSHDFQEFFAALATELSWLVARKQADDALDATADRYHHVFETALDAIFLFDPESTRVLDANMRARLLTGLPQSALIGTPLLNLAPPAEVQEHRATYDRVAAEGEVRSIRSLHFRHRKGHQVAVDFNARNVTIGGRLLAVAVIRDISEQVKAEVQLTASEELLRIIVEGTLDMFFYVHNTAGVFTYVSPSVSRITGHSAADWMTHYDRYTTDAPVNEKMRGYTEEAIQNGTIAPPYQCEIWHADGRRVLLEINERPILRDGQVIGVQGVARDITERRRLEEQLIQSQKMESIGLLAGGIAHDFNNILGGILGYASYLKTVVPSEDRIFQHIDTIERSALRAADLTAKLLAFARGGKYVVKPISINDVVEETLRLLRGSIDKSIIIEERLDRKLPAIEADGGQMQQVIMNLCVNARDAMPGGGRLTVTTAVVPWRTPFLLTQPDVRHTPYVCISVEDSGVGIDESIRAKIFDPFFTTKEKGKGTGLGLATVYGIVKNHGGYIEMDSEIGKGTAFRVMFPAAEREAVIHEEKTGQALGGSETILVVDDEDTIRFLLRDLLQAKGYRVLEAANGREALDVYGKHEGKVDLVILDMVMPEMGGRDTYIHLRELEPGIRTILSTGYAEDERARELLAMGVRAFVQKPYRIDELAGVVRSVLDAPPVRP